MQPCFSPPRSDGLVELNECVRRADSAAQVDQNKCAPQAVRCSLKDIIPSDPVRAQS